MLSERREFWRKSPINFEEGFFFFFFFFLLWRAIQKKKKKKKMDFFFTLSSLPPFFSDHPTQLLSLRLCYTNLILHHYELSVQHDIEQSLWKTIFYKVIEALRARLRRLKSMRVSNPSESLETELQKTSSTFSAFLTSASKFYIGLVAKLEVAFGLLYGGTPDYILPEEDGSKGAGRGGQGVGDSTEGLHELLSMLHFSGRFDKVHPGHWGGKQGVDDRSEVLQPSSKIVPHQREPPQPIGCVGHLRQRRFQRYVSLLSINRCRQAFPNFKRKFDGVV